MKTYSEKLRDPRWQKKRLEILQRDNFTCTACKDKETELHIHHLYYESENPWDCDDISMVTLCKHCHWIEETYKKLNYIIYKIIKNRTVYFVYGINDTSEKIVLILNLKQKDELVPMLELNKESYDLIKELVTEAEEFFNL